MHFRINQQSDIDTIISQARYFVSQNSSDENIISQFTTIVSEIVYNIIKYSPQGEISFERVEDKILLRALDEGKGFAANTEDAFLEGYSTAGSLGLGLASIVRMCDNLSISTSQNGTQIECIKEL